jgi:DNA repair exonuclease SbcCD ATPase subunit
MNNDAINPKTASPEFGNNGNTGLITGLFITLAVILAVGTFILVRSHKNQAQEVALYENQKLDLAIQLSQRDSIINEWVLAFNEIESDIKKITERENMLSLQSMNPEITQDKKNEILKEIQLIHDMIDQNKKRISSLNAQLRNSGIQIASLQARIDTLDAHIAQRDEEMAELRTELVDRNFEIGQLHQKVDTMETVIAERETRISEQTGELNKAFVVSGTYKDLKEKGLLVKEGRVLGLGGKESVQENSLNDQLFTQIDITETLTIPVNSKDAKLVSEHPANSYELIKDDAGKIAYVEIKDPATFWKISRYAVVELQR